MLPRRLFEYPPVADLRHPLCAGEMAFPAAARADFLRDGIAVQHDPRHLGPVCTVRLSVQQA